MSAWQGSPAALPPVQLLAFTQASRLARALSASDLPCRRGGGFLRSAEHKRLSSSSLCTQRQLGAELTCVISVCVMADTPQGERPGAEAWVPCNGSAQLSGDKCRCATVAPSASLTASFSFLR